MVNNPTSLTTRNLIKTKIPSGVLIVDQSPENREVLRTVLQRHGFEIFEAERDTDGLTMAEQCHPKVLVLDMDTLDSADRSVIEEFDHHAQKENASVVLLGRVPKASLPLANSDVISKPYHYGPLIRKIEMLLRQAEAPAPEMPQKN